MSTEPVVDAGGGGPDTVRRVDLTEAAAVVLRELTEDNGPLMFHQSGGCCDGSSPMCYPQGEFLTGDGDVRLGSVDIGAGPPVEVWMSRPQFAYWKHTHLTIDVVPGRRAGFSLEAPRGVRFLIRSRLFSDAESDWLEAHWVEGMG